MIGAPDRKNPVLDGEKFSPFWHKWLAGLYQLVITLKGQRRTGVTGTIASGTDVTHNLGRTPVMVLITAQESGPTNPYVSNVGAETFRINFGGGGSKVFGWSAEG